jgi:hypothetical protein
MTKRLSEEDRNAVDLLLDRTLIGADGNGGSFVSHAAAAPQARIESVERVLRVLEAMPTPEPSPDLIERTMQRIAGNGLRVPTPATISRDDRPHA